MSQYYPIFKTGPLKDVLKAGKRYYFPITNYNGVMKSALFTGEFDINGCAIMQSNSGELWSIPLCDLCIFPGKKKHG